MSTDTDTIPAGLTLRHTLRGENEVIYHIAWSPDGQVLASGSQSPDRQLLDSGSRDQIIRLWDPQTGQTLHILKGHTDALQSIAWSPDGQRLASGSDDCTIRLWDPQTGQQLGLLEGHTHSVSSISFSADGLLLASKSADKTVRLWRTDMWETVAILPEPCSTSWPPVLAFHPNIPALATLGEKDTVIRIWDLDYTTLLGAAPVTPSVHYINAKVVLVGESGVGKSGLGLVLTGKPFVPTESTHGRHVWTLSNDEIEGERKRKQIQETLLWDLAGQHNYHLIHQLHLHDATITLLIFDANRETDPLAGVRRWERALRQAARTRGEQAAPLKTFLVAARTGVAEVSVGNASTPSCKNWALQAISRRAPKRAAISAN